MAQEVDIVWVLDGLKGGRGSKCNLKFLFYFSSENQNVRFHANLLGEMEGSFMDNEF